MKYLNGNEKNQAIAYFELARQQALNATCERDKCGSIIVSKAHQVIGQGFNSPAGNFESQRTCAKKHELDPAFKSDKTCCIHAEIRAIMDALQCSAPQLPGSRLYFARIDSAGAITFAGKPYCTYCSKMTLDAGVAEFALWHKEGIAVYDTQEYNLLSLAWKPEFAT
jgi:deoxycytidylate deaminase